MCYAHEMARGGNMRIGNLVQHRDGDLGILLEINDNSMFVLWADGERSWTLTISMEVIC